MVVERPYLNFLVFALVAMVVAYWTATFAGAAEEAGNEANSGVSAGILDGKNFKGQTGEKGKKVHHEDELIFKDGQFTSTECFQDGFMPGPYTATVESDGIHFTAEMHSATQGKMVWQGTLKGDILDVMYTWTKERWLWSIHMDYWFKGTLVK